LVSKKQGQFTGSKFAFVAVQQEKYKKNAKMIDILNKPA
jgi:hypothetical protein